MKRFIAALILCLVLAIPADSKGLPWKSVQPVQHMDAETHQLQTHCTAYRANHYWVTDAHCVLNDAGEVVDTQLYVGGKKADVVKYDQLLDLALFHGGPSASDLHVGYNEPQVGVSLFFIGYPFGWPSPIYTAGWYAGHEDFGGGSFYSIYNVAAAPGSSGSPVFALDGSVVGQVQVIFCEYGTFCPVIGGAAAKTIRAFVYGE